MHVAKSIIMIDILLNMSTVAPMYNLTNERTLESRYEVLSGTDIQRENDRG
jgi:hypothetical protein